MKKLNIKHLFTYGLVVTSFLACNNDPIDENLVLETPKENYIPPIEVPSDVLEKLSNFGYDTSKTQAIDLDGELNFTVNGDLLLTQQDIEDLGQGSSSRQSVTTFGKTFNVLKCQKVKSLTVSLHPNVQKTINENKAAFNRLNKLTKARAGSPQDVANQTRNWKPLTRYIAALSIKNNLKAAVKEWNGHSLLKFRVVSPGKKSDIVIKMDNNGRLNPRTNAVAQGPTFQGNIRNGGSTIIINGETSVNRLGGSENGVAMNRYAPRTGRHWRYTLTHELGHTIGLSHTNEPGAAGSRPLNGTPDDQINSVTSIMSNFFGGETQFKPAEERNRGENRITLNNGDKKALRRLYGKGGSSLCKKSGNPLPSSGPF